jgi:hypothetical protein
MEGRGFLQGVHIAHPVQGGVIRGISDLLSGKANADKAGSQQRAADAASAVAFEILASIGSAPTSTPIPTGTKPATKFIETPTISSPGAYFAADEVLAQVGVPDVDQVSFSFEGAPEAFLRIVPMTACDRPIPLSTLNDIASRTALLGAPAHGGLTDINDHGAIFYQAAGTYRGGRAPMHWATQIFQNGELWSVSDRFVVRDRGRRPTSIPVPFIHALTLEQTFFSALHQNIAFAARHLGLTFPCIVEMGLLGVAKVNLILGDEDIPAIRAPNVIVRRVLSSADSAAINDVLLEFFSEVHDKTGYARPAGLFGFPLGPPRA